MEKTVVSGIVKLVKKINKRLSFVTLTPIFNEGWSETKIPFYLGIEKDYEGKVVEIITERNGFFGRNFKQTLKGVGMSSSIEMPYSFVKKINDAYKRL